MKIDVFLKAGYKIVDAEVQQLAHGCKRSIIYLRKGAELYYVWSNFKQEDWCQPVRVWKVCIYTEKGEGDLMNYHETRPEYFEEPIAKQYARALSEKGVFSWAAPVEIEEVELCDS